MAVSDPGQAFVEHLAASDAERRDRDPHGFWEMGETELEEWLDATSTRPGSAVFEQARQVLAQKRILAQRQAKLDTNHRKLMRQRLSSRVVQMGPQPTNRGFFGLLALIVAVGTLIAVVLPAVAARVFVGLVVVLVLGALFIPAIRYPLSRWLDRTFPVDDRTPPGH